MTTTNRPTPDQIRTAVANRTVNPKIVLNIYRSAHAEEIVCAALKGQYKLTEGWEGYDISRLSDGFRVEVKQTAALQTWKSPAKNAPRKFDIAPRSGEYDAQGFWRDYELPQRAAQVYVFATHDVELVDICDHSDIDQWRFYVAAASKLPAGQKSIGLGVIDKMAKSNAGVVGPLAWAGLYEAVEKIARCR